MATVQRKTPRVNYFFRLLWCGLRTCLATLRSRSNGTLPYRRVLSFKLELNCYNTRQERVRTQPSQQSEPPTLRLERDISNQIPDAIDFVFQSELQDNLLQCCMPTSVLIISWTSNRLNETPEQTSIN